MYLEKLELKHFRNYEDVNVAFSPQVNVLIGKNAQGKTNLLESIYVLAMARSHRTSNDREMVTFKKDAALIRGEVHQRLGNTKLELLISRKGKKAKVNHLEKARLSQYIGQLNVILFAPEDLALVKGAPSVRRRFIDMEFGQIDALYLHTLTEYRAVLRQRNKYLKELKTKKATDKVYLEILSEQLSESGSQIIFKRLEFLQELEKYADKLHNQITQGKEHLQFQYESTLKEYQGKSVLELKQSLIEQYKTMMDKEIFQVLIRHHSSRLLVAFHTGEIPVRLHVIGKIQDLLQQCHVRLAGRVPTDSRLHRSRFPEHGPRDRRAAFGVQQLRVTAFECIQHHTIFIA